VGCWSKLPDRIRPEAAFGVSCRRRFVDLEPGDTAGSYVISPWPRMMQLVARVIHGGFPVAGSFC
jgi:hypothetical protein